MWPFSKRAKLLRLFGRLAFYNDKGIDYARHDAAQVEKERASALGQVRDLVAAIGPESFPTNFLEAVESGAIATDLTGQYIDLLRAHFRMGAP
jgi:hypothetical protein